MDTSAAMGTGDGGANDGRDFAALAARRDPGLTDAERIMVATLVRAYGRGLAAAEAGMPRKWLEWKIYALAIQLGNLAAVVEQAGESSREVIGEMLQRGVADGAGARHAMTPRPVVN